MESRTGGPGKPTSRETGRAPRSDPYIYVWTLAGFCYVALLTDVYSRRILGWRVTTSKTTPLVMSTLEQALFTRRRADSRFTATGLVHHSDYAEPCVKPRNRSFACVGGVR